MSELRQAVRALLRAPAFSVTAVLVLAAGIGVATAAFSLVDGIMLRPLAYRDAERLFAAYESDGRDGRRTPSYPSFVDWQAALPSGIESMAFIRGDDFTARGEVGALALLGAFVSADFFRTVGAEPLLGRVFAEPAPGEENVVVLSHRLWLGRYGADRGVLGRTIATVDGVYTVIGVMPAGFREPAWADVWLPLRALPPHMAYALTQRNLHADIDVLARLASGTTVAEAERELGAVVARVAAAHGQADTWSAARLVSVRDRLLGNVATQLRILIAAVALVLLVACVNVANLQLARATAAARELAVRAALGASRGRLVRQLLAESVAIAVAAGVLGVLAARAGVQALVRWTPDLLPRLHEVAVDPRALLFAVAVAAGSVVAFGVLPALRVTGGGLLASLRAGSHGSGVVRAAARWRSALVVMQVALALVLTTGAALLLRSIVALQREQLGFRPDHVVALRVFPTARYDDAGAARALYERLQQTAARVPGVHDVALINHLPLAGGFMGTRVQTGRPVTGESDQALFRSASAEYFGVVGTRVLRGRGLAPADYAGPGAGIVVNESFVRQFFGDEDPLGRAVTVFRSAQNRPNLGEPMTGQIVGIVEDERFFRIDAAPPPSVFVPYTWDVWPNIFVVARTTGDPEAVMPALQRAIGGVDPDLPVAGPGVQTQWQPLARYVASRMRDRVVNGRILTVFAAVTLLLAMAGIFGVTAYIVLQRTREIGVRMALGARGGAVVRLVLAHALRLALLGAVLGLAGAWAATRVLRSQLYQLSATDPLTLGGAALLLVAAALAAGLLPALRAVRISPVAALRTD